VLAPQGIGVQVPPPHQSLESTTSKKASPFFSSLCGFCSGCRKVWLATGLWITKTNSLLTATERRARRVRFSAPFATVGQRLRPRVLGSHTKRQKSSITVSPTPQRPRFFPDHPRRGSMSALACSCQLISADRSPSLPAAFAISRNALVEQERVIANALIELTRLLPTSRHERSRCGGGRVRVRLSGHLRLPR
jgi:hypothetical protein